MFKLRLGDNFHNPARPNEAAQISIHSIEKFYECPLVYWTCTQFNDLHIGQQLVSIIVSNQRRAEGYQILSRFCLRTVELSAD